MRWKWVSERVEKGTGCGGDGVSERVEGWSE